MGRLPYLLEREAAKKNLDGGDGGNVEVRGGEAKGLDTAKDVGGNIEMYGGTAAAGTGGNIIVHSGRGHLTSSGDLTIRSAKCR